MSAETTQQNDLVPGVLFLTRADLDDAFSLLGGSERAVSGAYRASVSEL